MASKKTITPPAYPWERRTDLNETVVAYRNFSHYRDMAYIRDGNDEPFRILRKRSIAQLCKESKLCISSLKKQSTKYKWVERCRLYDDYMDQRLREANEAELIRMKKRHAKIGNSLIVKAMGRFLEISSHEIDVNTIVKLIELGAKLERISRGELYRNLDDEEKIARIEKLKAETKNEEQNANKRIIIVDNIPDVEVKSLAYEYDDEE